MSDMQIQQVLAQMRALAQTASGASTPEAGTGGVDFVNVLKKSLDQVDQSMKTSDDLTTRFVSGDESVSLSQAVIAMQKASLEFEAVTQVRNRLVSAYQEIMNMPI